MFDFVKEVELEGALSRIKIMENSQNSLIQAFDELSKKVIALEKVETPAKLLLRLEDLEMWRSKIHDMLTTKNPVTLKEKLSPIARKWKGTYNN